VSPDEIKQLRKDLNLSARELATSIKAETEDVWAWETGERFPTKRFVTRMLALRKAGGSKSATDSRNQPAAAAAKPTAAGAAKPAAAAAAKPASARAPDPVGLVRLADPELWTLVRKLLQHPALFDKVAALAKDYTDPAAPPAVLPAPELPPAAED